MWADYYSSYIDSNCRLHRIKCVWDKRNGYCAYLVFLLLLHHIEEKKKGWRREREREKKNREMGIVHLFFSFSFVISKRRKKNEGGEKWVFCASLLLLLHQIEERERAREQKEKWVLYVSSSSSSSSSSPLRWASKRRRKNRRERKLFLTLVVRWILLKPMMNLAVRSMCRSSLLALLTRTGTTFSKSVEEFSMPPTSLPCSSISNPIRQAHDPPIGSEASRAMVRVHSQISFFVFKRGKSRPPQQLSFSRDCSHQQCGGGEDGFLCLFLCFRGKKTEEVFLSKNIQGRNLLQNEETINKPRWITNRFLCKNGIAKLSAGLDFWQEQQ